MGQMVKASRILLVEDEVLISDMVAAVLADHGFEVHAVGDAGGALRHLIGGAPCDVLFTDINLPGGVDGAALARLARALRPELAVVYASGSIGGLHELSAVANSTFVPKPYDPARVCALLEKLPATAH